MSELPKIIVIVGPTASGKTNLSLTLAKEFNGEIISADSRQVYKKMNIATAKPLGTWERGEGGGAYMVEGVPHYMMDIVDPGEELSLADYKRMATGHIDDIIRRGRVPFVVGGTGLYIWSIVDNLDIPAVAPNKKLREGLEEKELEELVRMLLKLDPRAGEVVDLKNPRRVIRALEVSILSGESFVLQRQKDNPMYSALQIGIRHEREALNKRIEKRIDTEMRSGLVAETEALVKQRYGWNLPSMSGIGYRQVGEYLRGEVALEEAVDKMKTATKQYAKRQMTWFKRDKRVEWIEGVDVDRARRLVKNFLDN